MANMYIVDYENVGNFGMTGVRNLVPGERVVVFFRKDAKQLSFELWNEMNECKAIKVVMMVEHSEENALSLQLSSYLGCAVFKYLHFENFVIISNNAEYQILADFWEKELGVRISLFPSIEKAVSALAEPVEKGSDSKVSAVGSGK